jgi:hypothetical protein
MKHSYTALATSLLLAVSSAALAVDRNIELVASEGELLELYGDAFGEPKALDMDTIKAGTTISLGGVGVKSNISGSCKVNFSTTNNYKLSHTTIIGEVLTSFSLKYADTTFSRGNTTAVTTSCNVSPSALTLNPAVVDPDKVIKSGAYKDTIIVTVTSA